MPITRHINEDGDLEITLYWRKYRIGSEIPPKIVMDAKDLMEAKMKMVDDLKPDKISELIMKLDSENVVKLLSNLKEIDLEKIKKILEQISPEKAAKISQVFEKITPDLAKTVAKLLENITPDKMTNIVTFVDESMADFLNSLGFELLQFGLTPFWVGAFNFVILGGWKCFKDKVYQPAFVGNGSGKTTKD